MREVSPGFGSTKVIARATPFVFQLRIPGVAAVENLELSDDLLDLLLRLESSDAAILNANLDSRSKMSNDMLEQIRLVPRQIIDQFIRKDRVADHQLLVDGISEDGDRLPEEGGWFDGDGVPLIDGKTVVESKVAAADAASLFWDELLESVDSLTDISDDHGPRTLADLMYLQAAILRGTFIDCHPDQSLAEVVTALPSGDRWAKFIKTERVTERDCSGG